MFLMRADGIYEDGVKISYTLERRSDGLYRDGVKVSDQHYVPIASDYDQDEMDRLVFQALVKEGFSVQAMQSYFQSRYEKLSKQWDEENK